jgi:hypothetical protein
VGTRRRFAKRNILSLTDISLKNPLLDTDIPTFVPFAIWKVPDVAFIMPINTLRRVVLPEPFDPNRPHIDPGFRVKLT